MRSSLIYFNVLSKQSNEEIGKKNRILVHEFAIPSVIWCTSGIQILRISALINMPILCMETETYNWEICSNWQ